VYTNKLTKEKEKSLKEKVHKRKKLIKEKT